MYAERLFFCCGCGVPLLRRASQWAKPRCIHCAIERMQENAYQLRAKQGAFYDKWAEGLARAAREQVSRSRSNKASEKRG